MPFDVDALRASILRKLAIIADEWRDCPDRACRRHRTCASPRMPCLNMQRERRPVSPKNEAEAKTFLQRALKRRSAGQSGAR